MAATSTQMSWGWRHATAIPFIQSGPDGVNAIDPNALAAFGNRVVMNITKFMHINAVDLRALCANVQEEPGMWDKGSSDSNATLERLVAFLSLQLTRVLEEKALVCFCNTPGLMGEYQQSAFLLWHTGLYGQNWDSVYALCRLNVNPEFPTQRWALSSFATLRELRDPAWWSTSAHISDMCMQLGLATSALHMLATSEEDPFLPRPVDAWSACSGIPSLRCYDRTLPTRCNEGDLLALVQHSAAAVRTFDRATLDMSVALSLRAVRAQPSCATARLFRDGVPGSRPRVQLLLPFWRAGSNSPSYLRHGADITMADGALAIDCKAADGGPLSRPGASLVYVPAAIIDPQTALLESRLFGPLAHCWLRAKVVTVQAQQQQQQQAAAMSMLPPGGVAALQAAMSSQAGAASLASSLLASLGAASGATGAGAALAAPALPGTPALSLAGLGALPGVPSGGAASSSSFLMNPLLRMPMAGLQGGPGPQPPSSAGAGALATASSSLPSSAALPRPMAGSALFDFSSLPSDPSASGSPTGHGGVLGMEGLHALAGLPSLDLGMSLGLPHPPAVVPQAGQGGAGGGAATLHDSHEAGSSGAGGGGGGGPPVNFDSLLSTPPRAPPSMASKVAASTPSSSVTLPAAQGGAGAKGGAIARGTGAEEPTANSVVVAPPPVVRGSSSGAGTSASPRTAGGEGVLNSAAAALEAMGITVKAAPSVPAPAPAHVPAVPGAAKGLGGTQQGLSLSEPPPLVPAPTSAKKSGSWAATALGGSAPPAAAVPPPALAAVAASTPLTTPPTVVSPAVAPTPAPTPSLPPGQPATTAWSHTRYKGTILSVVISQDKPHGFICVHRKREPELWSRVCRESPDQMRTQEGKDVATIVFQAVDMEDGKGAPLVPELMEGAKLPSGHYSKAIATLQQWKGGSDKGASSAGGAHSGGADVSFEVEYSHKFKRFVAHRVRSLA